MQMLCVCVSDGTSVIHTQGTLNCLCKLLLVGLFVLMGSY